MRRISETLDFILFTAGYEDRLIQEEPRREVEERFAERGIALAFYWSGFSDWRSAGEHLFGETANKVWSRGIIDLLKQEGAEILERDAFSSLLCLKALSNDRPLGSDDVGDIYSILSAADYCSMYGYSTQQWEIESTGQRFLLVSADAESG